MRIEWQEQTVLGALRFVDAVTGRPVTEGLLLEAPGLRLLRKRNGDRVVLDAEGVSPAGTDFPIDVRSTTGVYSPRRAILHLPRDPNPANAALADSLFQPALVAMLPSGLYPAGANLALLRVTVRRSTDGARVGNALVRLRTAVPTVSNARALTDAAGEALLVVAGVPLASAGPGATVVPDIAAQLDALVDPALATFTADAAIDSARAAAAVLTAGFPDPDDIENRLGAAAPAAITVRIGPGRLDIATFSWVPA